jgi:hypothetical protein
MKKMVVSLVLCWLFSLALTQGETLVDVGNGVVGVLGKDQTMANSVIQKTAEWFAQTL